MKTESLINSQAEQQQTGAKDVLGSMPSFEDHMKEMSSTDLGKIKSPINGGELAVSGENKFVDQSTGQEFKLDESGKIIPFLDVA